MITCLALGTGGLGRFGNNCFSAASVIGISIKSGQPFGFPHWRTYDNANFSQPVDDMEDYFVNPLPRIPEGLTWERYPYFWEYRDINLPTGNWDFFVHLQSVKWFRHCIDTVRHYFRMKDEPAKWKDWTALHWRAGDYIADENAYHPRLSIEYYKKAIDLLPADSKFLCFSDDIDQFSDMIAKEYGSDPNGERFIYVKGDYLTSFKMMKTCKNFITANSSFSHFAALMGEHPEKKIIMPRLWFGAAAGGLNFDSLYPEEAIVI